MAIANNLRLHAYLRILEQPASLRFRYECEGRPGNILGENSTPCEKTFVKIQVMGYKGKVKVVVSCVTGDDPPKPHPFKLTGYEDCGNGVCIVVIDSEDMSFTFNKLGIYCVRRRDIEEIMKIRIDKRIDPFNTGFAHCKDPSNIEVKFVRICFQAFRESERGVFNIPIKLVVSDIIYDKKMISDLKIHKLSHYSCSVDGGKEIILLCDKVYKDDIKVQFFEKVNGQIKWNVFSHDETTLVHKNYAISFICPEYWKKDIIAPVETYVQLRRPSDEAASEPLRFEFRPSGPISHTEESLQATPSTSKGFVYDWKTEGHLYSCIATALSHRSEIQNFPLENLNSETPHTNLGHFIMQSILASQDKETSSNCHSNGSSHKPNMSFCNKNLTQETVSKNVSLYNQNISQNTAITNVPSTAADCTKDEISNSGMDTQECSNIMKMNTIELLETYLKNDTLSDRFSSINLNSSDEISVSLIDVKTLDK